MCFFKSHEENEAGNLVSDLFLFFKKALYEVKASGLQLSFKIFWWSSNWLAYDKNKLHKTLDYWSKNMINFDFLEKVLGIVSPPHCVWFFKKMFFMLYSINWPNFNVWLHLHHEILGNMCIANVCFPGCDLINFEINLIFLIKLFSSWPKSWDKTLWNELLKWNKKHFSWV